MQKLFQKVKKILANSPISLGIWWSLLMFPTGMFALLLPMTISALRYDAGSILLPTCNVIMTLMFIFAYNMGAERPVMFKEKLIMPHGKHMRIAVLFSSLIILVPNLCILCTTIYKGLLGLSIGIFIISCLLPITIWFSGHVYEWAHKHGGFWGRMFAPPI